MSRPGPAVRALIAIVVASMLIGGGVPSTARAAASPSPEPDASDVALVFDFSASILDDKAAREEFAAALERIADRVKETSADLTAGDATVSFVQFATRAADVPGCVDLKLLGNPQAVTTLETCLRTVAADYRKGITAARTRTLGIDTNYVAAMEQAATHLPADSPRPVLILLTAHFDVSACRIPRKSSRPATGFSARTPRSRCCRSG